MQFPFSGEASRRELLRAGSLALASVGLADVLRRQAEANPVKPQRQKSVIMVHLLGGPSHIDMYDMKPSAPDEYRGEFLPVASTVPGLEMCELMPQQAQIADKWHSILRGARHLPVALRLSGASGHDRHGREETAARVRLRGQPTVRGTVEIDSAIRQPWRPAIAQGIRGN